MFRGDIKQLFLNGSWWKNSQFFKQNSNVFFRGCDVNSVNVVVNGFGVSVNGFGGDVKFNIECCNGGCRYGSCVYGGRNCEE